MTSKRAKAISELKQPESPVKSVEGLDTLKGFHKTNGAKFNESIDLSIVLGIDARKMNVRGSTVMPHSTGKEVSICCFVASGEDTSALTAAGATAGDEDLLNSIIAGETKCDVLLTLKKEMPKLGKFGRQLGGKGLMPNPKDGTIADDIAELATKVAEAAKGKVKFRNDKGGIVHVPVGKVNLENTELVENIRAIIAEVRKLKPAKAKGKYLKKIYISSTMGPSVQIDSSEFE